MAAIVAPDTGVNSDQEADSGGIDVGNLAEIGDDVAASDILQLLAFDAQVFGILTRREAPFQPEDANVRSDFEVDLHPCAFAHGIMSGLKLAPFYPVLDTALCARAEIPVVEACEAVLEGGARLLQLRHKQHFSRRMFADAQNIAKMCATAGAQFVINDRADIAALLNAALHLGQDDPRPRDVRKFLPHQLGIGFSTHNEKQLREAAGEPADYLAIGPIFQTKSKENPDPVVGLKDLEKFCRMATKPLVAIGGITRESALRTKQAGVDSVAVIGDLLPEERNKLALRKRTEEWVQLLKT